MTGRQIIKWIEWSHLYFGRSENGVFPDEGEPVATLLEMDVPSPKGAITLIDWVGEYIQSQPGGVVKSEYENNWEFINLD